MEVRALGALEVVVDGHAVPLGGPKERALLALLVVHRGPCPQDRLIDDLWSDDPPPGARKTLQTYVWRLRNLLPDGAITSTAGGYQLHPTDESDIVRFEQLVGVAAGALKVGEAQRASELYRDALELWRGEPFGGCAPVDPLEARRTWLEELHSQAVEGHLDAELRLGHHSDLIGELEHLVRTAPLRERLWEMLALALYRSGRQAEALRACRRARDRLVDELGLEPGARLTDLERSILMHDPSLQGDASATDPSTLTLVDVGERRLPGSEERRTSLPVALTALIGRDAERVELAAAMDSGARLVTMTGPGGVGKTRLALDVAAGRAAVAPDGLWWVDLAAVDSGGSVADAALRALGFVESPALRALDQLAASLVRWQAVLVLDNCEHVIADAAVVADRLLQRCPDLTIIATSREPLAVPGEAVWPVSPLPVAAATAAMAEVLRSDGVRLFVERARQASPMFEVNGVNVSAVGEVCRRLDGIPLALELAAARVRTMPLADIVRRLEDRFALLTGGGRTVPPRRQTMWASLMWSHDLLGDAEQRVFRRLWPFAGGFTVAAAVAVAGFDLERSECHEALVHLADQSLVQLDVTSDRYVLLETMRQFAADRAAAAGETDLLRERHIDWVVEFLKSLDIAMLEDATLDGIDAEYPNIRLGLESAIATRSDQAVSIVMALAQYWSIAGRLRDAVDLADPVLAELHEREPRRWAWIVARLGMARTFAGDLEFVGSKTIAALEIAKAAEDWSTVGHCLYSKINAEASSSASYEQAFQTAVQAGDRRLTVILAAASPGPMLGTDEGERLLQRARDLARGVDISGTRYIPDGYGAVHAALRGEPLEFGDRARRCFAEKLRTPVVHLPLAAVFTMYGRHYGDHDLIDLVIHRIPGHWRDLPAQQARFALFDRAVGLTERLPQPLPDELYPTAPRGWLLIDVVVRLLLDEERDDEVIELTQSLGRDSPAAYVAGRLARAWVAYRRDHSSFASTLSQVIEDTGHWGMRLHEAEAVELAAVRLCADQPAVTAELLEAVDTARRDIGLHWRPSYQRAAVERAHATVRGLLAPERLSEARTRGGASTLVASAASAVRHLRGAQPRH